MSEGIKVIPRVIIIPRREIVKHGNRWIVYLPQDYNEIWEEIKRQGLKVRLYLEILK